MLHICALYTDPVDIPQFGLEASPLRPSFFCGSLVGHYTNIPFIAIYHLIIKHGQRLAGRFSNIGSRGFFHSSKMSIVVISHSYPIFLVKSYTTPMNLVLSHEIRKKCPMSLEKIVG